MTKQDMIQVVEDAASIDDRFAVMMAEKIAEREAERLMRLAEVKAERLAALLRTHASFSSPYPFPVKQGISRAIEVDEDVALL